MRDRPSSPKIREVSGVFGASPVIAPGDSYRPVLLFFSTIFLAIADTGAKPPLAAPAAAVHPRNGAYVRCRRCGMRHAARHRTVRSLVQIAEPGVGGRVGGRIGEGVRRGTSSGGQSGRSLICDCSGANEIYAFRCFAMTAYRNV